MLFRSGFSKELSLLRMDLLDFVSLIELELDFSEEEVEFADRERLKELVYNIKSKIKNLADSFRFGNAVKNGIPVAIIGETNVGKSTLLNWLLNEEKAIVSDIHGTTRDVIEDTVQIDGILFRFIDTAGIRQTEDTIENLGIERTYKKIKEASIVLLMIDSSYVISEIKTFLDRNLPILKDKKVILLFNKKDIITHDKRNELDKVEVPKGVVKLFVSAKQDRNKRDLLDALISLSEQENAVESNVIVTNMRHYEALNKSLEAIARVEEGMDLGLSGDLLSRDIRDCMHYLGEITGEISNDDILGNVFGKFCIGK